MVDCPFPFFEGFSGNRWVSLSKRFIAMQSGSAILFCVPRKLHHHLLTTEPDPRWQFIKKLHQGIISKTSQRVRRIRKSPFKRLQTVNRPLGFEFYSSGHARFRQMISVTNDHPLHWIVHVSLGHAECSFQVHKGEAFVGRTWRRWNQCFRSIVKGCRTDLLGIGHSRCGACEWTSWYRKAIAGNTLRRDAAIHCSIIWTIFRKKQSRGTVKCTMIPQVFSFNLLNLCHVDRINWFSTTVLRLFSVWSIPNDHSFLHRLLQFCRRNRKKCRMLGVSRDALDHEALIFITHMRIIVLWSCAYCESDMPTWDDFPQVVDYNYSFSGFCGRNIFKWKGTIFCSRRVYYIISIQ